MGREKPEFWDESAWNVDNHPVVGVSWYEAVAWCRWVTHALSGSGDVTRDQEIRLPNEAEWEWAAYGPDNFLYPWGNDWRDDACNHEAAGLDQTSAVGLFPAGVSRWLAERPGNLCYDLSGNVWEWCVTKWHESRVNDGDTSLDSDARRVLRGGSWCSPTERVRSGFRHNSHPGNCDNSGGFRCVRSHVFGETLIASPSTT